MQVINISGHEFTTIATLKAFAAKHGIVPAGNKSLKATWIEAIESYLKVQAEVFATAKDAEITAEEAAAKVEEVAVTALVAVVKVLTSDNAIAVYRAVLRGVMLAIVFAIFAAIKVGKWAWANRDKTAVYHWVPDALTSQRARSMLTHGLIAEWLMVQWIDTAGEWRDRAAVVCRDRSAQALSRLGLI